jgi:hypothetical protein
LPKAATGLFSEYDEKTKPLYIKRIKPKLNCIIKKNPQVKEEYRRGIHGLEIFIFQKKEKGEL